ncbi:MAG: translocation/assembly module TamB domain-containing protein [Gemmatimonadota bacterium]|nr:MAG: translocation/assembly module TamB domain-containing protein [Gemmatimonadota bacterium]
MQLVRPIQFAPLSGIGASKARPILWVLYALAGWLVATILGISVAALGTETGRRVVAQAMLDVANDAVRGSVTVGEIGGSFLGGLRLSDLVVRGEDGVQLATISRVELSYGPRDFLGGGFALGKLTLEQPRIDLVDPRGGGLNIKEVLGLGGPSNGGRTPLISFRDVDIIDGAITIRTPAEPGDSITEGEEWRGEYMRVRRVTDLNAHFPYVRLASPLPGQSGIHIWMQRLRANVTDPHVELLNARGRVNIRGDSIGLALSHVDLPNSRAGVEGVLVLDDGKIRPSLTIESEWFTTDDVRGLVADVPAAMIGSGALTVRTAPDGVTRFVGDPLTMEGVGGGGSARGRLAMVLGPASDWAFVQTRLDLDDFDLEYIRAYFDTLPLAGRVTGRFEADGPKQALNLGFDVVFRDSLVEGWPATTLTSNGTVAVGVPGEIVFRDYQLDYAHIDLGTVRRLLPAVDLQGMLSASGTLNGPWLEFAFEGDLSHVAVPPFVTDARGTVRIDARGEVLGVWSDLAFDSLSLDGLHTSYPSLTVGGSFTGRMQTAGFTDSLWIDADLAGPAGAVLLEGAVSLLSNRKGVYGLDLRAARLDLAQLHRSLPQTVLYGRVWGSGIADSVRGPSMQANVRLFPSSLVGVPLDSAELTVGIADSTVYVDSLAMWGPEAHVSGSGQLGLWNNRTGTVNLAAAADSLATIEPLLEALLGPTDTTRLIAAGLPTGSFASTILLTGAINDLELSGRATATDVRRGAVYLSRADLDWSWGAAGLEVQGTADSLDLSGKGFTLIRLGVRGPVDSLTWHGRSRFGPRSDEQWIGWGSWLADEGSWLVPVDSLGLRLASGAWFARPPLVIRVGREGIDFYEATASSDVGVGTFTVNGRIPLQGSGSFAASVQALPVADLWALLQFGYHDVEGEVNGTFRLEGTSDDPTMTASVSMLDAMFGDFRAPQFRGSATYSDRRLEGDVEVRRRGEEILRVRLELPVDLALSGVGQRQLPGRISIIARADSVDLSLLNAITPLVRHIEGTLDANFGIAGTWENPELTGRLTLSQAVADYPAIGVRHEDINGRFTLTGDTIRVDQLELRSGEGSAQISGFVRLERLSRPVLDLRIHAQTFEGLDVRDFLSLTATGDVQLRGPVFGSTLTGNVAVTDGVLHFADLVEKELISFEDTLLFVESELVDTTLIRREGLGAAFENRFYNSMYVDSLELEMGSNVWMRSSEANIQLLGNVTMNKVRDRYSLTGTLQTPRGTYRLSPGPSLMQLVATREFTVTRGEVTYFGTPDLNAAIDIDARHNVHSVRGEDITVFVNIGGTLYEPTLRFTSDIQPPIAETEILSYVFFGAPSVEAFAGTGTEGVADQRLAQQGLNQFLAAVSGQLEYGLISDLNVPLDYVQIRPSLAGREMAGLDLAVGKRLGDKWFVTLSPRACLRPGQELFAWEDFGASLEYRFTREWMFQVSGDPVQGCVPYSSHRLVAKYQLGVDFLWEKRY